MRPLSALEQLTKILVPPSSPVATGSPEAWAAVEARLGTRLPEDYKSFVSIYGFGAIDGAVWVFSPFANALSHLERRLEEHQQAHVVMVEYQDEPEGLIPWASNDYRGMCFWETDNPDPDSWTVYAALDDDAHRFPENMTTFLLKVLLGEHLSTVFGGDERRFRPPIAYHPERT